MNQRIQELALQAGIQMFEDRAFGWSVIAGTDHNVQRFVELIVAECAQIADDGFASSNFGNGITGHQLLKHFGVGE